jgi:predicted transcriptional regulator
MDAVYAVGGATVTDVWLALPDPPSRASIRTLMRILEEKGHLRHRKRGREFVYRPVRARARAGRSALRRVLETFFDGSLEKAVAAHLSNPSTQLSDDEAKRLAELIRQSHSEAKAEQ